MEKTQMKNDTDSKMKTQTPEMQKYMKTQRKKIGRLQRNYNKIENAIKRHGSEVLNQKEATNEEPINDNINEDRKIQTIDKRRKIRRLRRNYKRVENAIKREQELINNNINEEREIQTDNQQHELTVNNE